MATEEISVAHWLLAHLDLVRMKFNLQPGNVYVMKVAKAVMSERRESGWWTGW